VTGNEFAKEIETSTAELAEFITGLTEAELKSDYCGQANQTVASIVEYLTAGVESAHAWLMAVTGEGSPAPAQASGRSAPDLSNGPFDKAWTIARLRTSLIAVSDLVRVLSRSQLDAAAPRLPGLDVGNRTLGQVINELIDRQRRSISLMRESVTRGDNLVTETPSHIGRTQAGSPEGSVKAYKTQLAARFPDEGPVEAPPPIPDGWSIAPPDFVGVGAQRSGSTWWYSVIASHPDVQTVPDRAKGIHFFDDYRGVQSVPAESYHRYFPRPPGKLCGEWTPRYMYDYWTPPILRAVAPQAKLLAILRDPVERFISGVGRNIAYGFTVNPMLLHHNFAQGLYWSQLRGLLEHFPPSQVLILQYEQCVTDPVSQTLRTFEFLGLDPYEWEMPLDMIRRVNATKTEKLTVNAATLATMRLAYQAELRQLFADFPEIDGTLWPTSG
jgi:Sulfotransferase domain